jgi:hypothetical protein
MMVNGICSYSHIEVAKNITTMDHFRMSRVPIDIFQENFQIQVVWVSTTEVPETPRDMLGDNRVTTLLSLITEQSGFLYESTDNIDA